MKKNLITVIILAIGIINLVFNILLVFVYMPSANKTNKLITSISEILELELNTDEEDSFDVGNLVAFKLEQGNALNLADDGSGVQHVILYGLTINLDKTASDYSSVNENLTSSTALIYDTVRSIICQYTYTDIIDVNVQNEIKNRILTSLQDTFNTECIYSVSFYDWVAQ